MIVDLHAHYPMHLLPSSQGTPIDLLSTAAGRDRLRDRIRARLIGLASRFANYSSFESGPRVTMPQLRAGGVGVALSVVEGVLVDLSHMSARALEDTFELLDQLDPDRRVPVVATHSAFRFGRQEYGVDEDTVRLIAGRDGVVGVIFAQHQLNDGIRMRETKTFDESFEVICRHLDRIAEITGSHAHTAIGSDLDGFIKPTMGGLESMSDMALLEQALILRYGAVDADLICSANSLRVLRAGWGS